jgi:hypothetical protein
MRISYVCIREKSLRDPWLMLLPFLVIYIFLAIVLPTHLRIGDELRYLWYAGNLIKGFYSPAPPDILLWNGPGYPLVISPFVAMHLPIISITILNAVFMYISVVLLFLVLNKFVSFKRSLFFTLFWATYINLYVYLIFVLSEAITALLITMLLFFVVRTFETTLKRYVIISGLILGYLVLTKIIFAYVILLFLAGMLIIWLLNPKNINYKKGMIIILVAFATTIPYQVYTYHLTGRFFYWGNSGGQQLYWMTSPFHTEYGDWMTPFLNFKNDHLGRIANNDSLLKARHQTDINEIYRSSKKNVFVGVAQDDAFKKLAIRNILQHPIKYFLNCISNSGRMIFGFPFSYKSESPISLVTIPWNAFLMTFILLCSFHTIRNWKKLMFSLRFLLVLVMIYLFGSTLVSAYPRMFNVIVPIILFWIALILQKVKLVDPFGRK